MAVLRDTWGRLDDAMLESIEEGISNSELKEKL